MSERRGWGLPAGSHKWHYFDGKAISLCAKWGFYQGPLDDSDHESSDNCATCKRKRRVLAKARGEDGDDA